MAHPTTKELNDNIISQFESEFGQSVPLLGRAFLRNVAKVMAAVFITLWKYSTFQLVQQFPTLATIQWVDVAGKRIRPLVEWGRTFGAGDPRYATQAELTSSVTVDNTVSSINTGLQLIEPNSQIVFTVISTPVLPEPPAGTYNVTIRATGDQNDTFGAGVQGNLPIGTTLNFITPQSGVSTGSAVTGQTVVGVEAETEAEYRQRVEDRLQKRPQGGAYADYEEWAESIEGIVASYSYASDPGEVDVYIEVSSTTDPDGIAPGAKITEVYDYIETQRPAGSKVNVYSISRIALDVTITGLGQTDDPVALKASIDTAIDEYFRAAEPATPISSPNARNDSVSTGGLGGVVNDVVNANGAVYLSARMSYLATDIDRYQLPPGQKIKAGTITYV